MTTTPPTSPRPMDVEKLLEEADASIVQSESAAKNGLMQYSRHGIMRRLVTTIRTILTENAALRERERELAGALHITQYAVTGSWKDGYSIHVTGHQMDAIRTALTAQPRGEDDGR